MSIPVSGFMTFARAKRVELVESEGPMKMSELGRRLGACWRELSEEEKMKWRAIAEGNQVRRAGEKRRGERRWKQLRDLDDRGRSILRRAQGRIFPRLEMICERKCEMCDELRSEGDGV